MLAALREAGFVGIEQGDDGAIYARAAADLPECRLVPLEGERWHFALQWPLRADSAQRAAWAARHPDAPLDVDLGETRMQFVGGVGDVPRWADLVAAMVSQCMAWRRQTRQRDEGM